MIAGLAGAAKTFRIKRVTFTKKWTPGGARYYEVTFEIEYRVATHRKFPLDQGLREWSTGGEAGGERVNIKDDNGKDVTEAVKLDNTGYALAAGSNPLYMTYDAYPTASWSALGLPTAT